MPSELLDSQGYVNAFLRNLSFSDGYASMRFIDQAERRGFATDSLIVPEHK